jgi:hypothetical protein
MPLLDRAAQFAPFAALTGHGDAIKETARLTEAKIELDEEEKARLNDRLAFIIEHIGDTPEISITYFLPDGRKSGGAYITKTGAIKKVDDFERTVVMMDDAAIPIEDVIVIEGDCFSELDTEP